MRDSNAQLAFVQQALAAANGSERSSRIIVGVLAILAVVVFIWMHLRMFPQRRWADCCTRSFEWTFSFWSSCSPSPCTFVRL